MSTKTRYVSISAGPMKPFHRPLEGYYFHWWLRDGQIEGRREMGSEHYGIHLYFDGWRPLLHLSFRYERISIGWQPYYEEAEEQ